MTKQRLGILGGMGRPTRLAPCPAEVNSACTKVLAFGQNAWGAALAASGPMPQHDRRDGYV